MKFEENSTGQKNGAGATRSMQRGTSNGQTYLSEPFSEEEIRRTTPTLKTKAIKF